MPSAPPLAAHVNLVFAWLWILMGFLTGALLGTGFQRSEWLGGYDSLRRRLYRLGHISFFGLATMNLLFYFTVQTLAAPGPVVPAASWLFVIGGISMPLCCLVMAHAERMKPLFVVPVTSLITAAALTLWEVART